jgi:spore maturation protein CgeB
MMKAMQYPGIASRIFPVNCDFLLPYLEVCGCLTSDRREADFMLVANSTDPGCLQAIAAARRYGKPIAWWTIEDPNSLETFLAQAAEADFVFTTDEDCIPEYQERLAHDRVFWLPLACSPEFHYPSPLEPGASEFVISANWYTNQARLWGVATVVEPLRAAGRSLTLFCYETFMWPEAYRIYWKGRTSCRTVAEQYRHGRVVLGLNNQGSGMDGRAHTVMTSMRTFEALACGKPFLAAHSDAYHRLGLQNGTHLASVRTAGETAEWADRLLGREGERIARAGREFVLDGHTYRHRLAAMANFIKCS